jgi:hypothetical protein
MYETYGVKPTYFSGHISENAFMNLRRRGKNLFILPHLLFNTFTDGTKHRILVAADKKLESLNQKLQKSYESVLKARRNIVDKIQHNLAHHDISIQLLRLTHLADKAVEFHNKLVDEGQDLVGTGTGRVVLHQFDINP